MVPIGERDQTVNAGDLGIVREGNSPAYPEGREIVIAVQAGTVPWAGRRSLLAPEYHELESVEITILFAGTYSRLARRQLRDLTDLKCTTGASIGNDKHVATRTSLAFFSFAPSATS